FVAMWRQQHPNDPRQYEGPGALPQDEQQKWYAQKGRQMWQQAVVHQANQPNNGQSPVPQGGLSRPTTGIPAGDDPIWAQRGQQWYQQQGAPFGGGTTTPAGTARQPVGTPGPGAEGKTPTGKRPLPFSNEQQTQRFANVNAAQQ